MSRLSYYEKFGISISSKLRGFIVLGAISALTACGGGGSSSGGSTTGNGSSGSGGGGTTPTGQGLSLPSVLTSSLEENFFSSSFGETSYNVTVTDTTLEPTNFRLTGADATNFQITTTISTTSNPNVFTTELDFGNAQAFDFEAPSDANGDNIYNFDYVFDYGDTTYTIPVEITVENIREDVAIGGSVVRLDFEPTDAKVMPDVTGDSLSDLILLENEEQFFTSGVYILSSETLASSVGQYNVIPDSDLYANFNPANDGTENLTSRPSADGSGFDLLYSNTFSDRYVYYDVNSAADSAFLALDVDPADAANGGTDYVHSDASAGTITQIIHDVNLDGQNDFFSYDVFNGEMGIKFGTAGNSQPQQSSAPDILITNNDFAGTLPTREIEIATVPDIDGDGNRELMILSPFFLAEAGNDGTGAVWIINSSYLATNPDSFDLVEQTTNSTNVRQISGTIDQRFGQSYTELTDGNGDPVLIFGTGNSSENQGLIGASLTGVTSLGQFSDASNLAAVGVTYVLGTDPSIGVTTNERIGAIRPISDVDGDGQTDFLSLNSVIVKAADLLAGANVIGDEYEVALASAPRLKRDAGSFGSGNVVYLEDQGLIGFSQGTTDGEFVLVSADDISAAVASEEGDIVVTTPF